MRLDEKKKTAAPAFFMIIILTLCFLLFSCVSFAGKKQLYAYLTDRARYVLLPHGEIEKPMDSFQIITASFAGQDYYFNAWVRADKDGMYMSLFNELGASMGDLSYRDGDIYFSSRVFPKELNPEYIVADFQLCFYNPQSLGRALGKCGLNLEVQSSNRRILSGKNLITEIEKTHNTVKLINHLRGYSYTLAGEF